MKMHIAFSTNRHFLPLCLVAITSILKNTDIDNQLSIVVMYSDLLAYDLESIRALRNIREFDLQLIYIDPKPFAKYPVAWTSTEAWYRCKLAELLPNLDRILYLDTDIIVRRDLSDLFNTDLQGAMMGAIEDVSDSKVNMHKIKISDFYFNSGVLLLDLVQCRKQKLFDNIIQYLKHNTPFQADQSTLNKIADGKKFRLSPTYNYMNVWWRENNCQYDESYQKLYDNCDPHIVHFTGLKPTSAKCRNMFKPEWDNYFDLTMQTIVNARNIIPIILSSDNRYAPQMYVTILSMLQNKKPITIYDFYLMIPETFSSKNKHAITTVINKHSCNVNFINMKDKFNDCTMHIKHITTPTYYRLLAADLLPQYYKKCIYLDVDICVLTDLSEMFNIDMGDNYVAGVPAISYWLNNDRTTARLNIPTAKHYINAGALVMNLDLIRHDDLTKQFVELSKQNFSSQDQDVLNVACFGRIKILPLKYNLMTKYDFTNIENPAFFDIYGKQEIDNALLNPVVIHYADKIKPWFKKHSRYATIWWHYAKLSPFAKSFAIKYWLKKLFR